MRNGEADAKEGGPKLSDEELAKLKLEKPVPKPVPGMPGYQFDAYGRMVPIPQIPPAVAGAGAGAGIPAAGPVPGYHRDALAAGDFRAAAAAIPNYNPYVNIGGAEPNFQHAFQDYRRMAYERMYQQRAAPAPAVPANVPQAFAVTPDDLGRGKRRKKK